MLAVDASHLPGSRLVDRRTPRRLRVRHPQAGADRAARRGRPRKRPGSLRRRPHRSGEDPVHRAPPHARAGGRRTRRQLVLRLRVGGSRGVHAGACSPLRGASGRARRTGRADDGEDGRPHRAAHQRGGWARSDMVGGRSDGRDRSPQPHRRFAAARAQRRSAGPPLPRHERGLRFRAACRVDRSGPRREHPAASGHLRGASRAFVRDARRGAHGADDGGARGGDEHRARGACSPAHGRARGRAVVHHQPGCGHRAASARPRRGRGRSAFASGRAQRAPGRVDRARGTS